jgi:hypothetical protein
MRKTVRLVVLAAVAGTVFQFGGCLKAVFQQALLEVAADTVQGFIPFDLADLIPGGGA